MSREGGGVSLVSVLSVSPGCREVGGARVCVCVCSSGRHTHTHSERPPPGHTPFLSHDSAGAAFDPLGLTLSGSSGRALTRVLCSDWLAG